MQYKGEDLDLRVPHGRASRESYTAEIELPGSNGRWLRNPSILTGSEPVWVDETLLACCNYAFDVAQANGAAEVGLEHLVNAMTRVDAAARLLESRGVREGQLRRDSAALIASEVPAANAGEAVSPRRSMELEEILRRASDLALRRGGTAGVDDALWALLHSNRDHPVVLLLRRLTPDWQRADWGRMREPMQESIPRAVQLIASDSTQGRIAGFEDGLRHMQADIASDRKLFIDLVRDLQRDVVAQRSDAASFRGDLGQRLETLERAMHTRVESGRLPSQIADRMSQLEKAVHSGLGEGARNWAHLGQRLAQLETALGRRDAPAFEAMAERITTLERSIQQNFADAARRLATFETLLTDGGIWRGAEAVQGRLQAIERRLEAAESEGQRRQGQLAERIEGLFKLNEEGHGEAAKSVSDAVTRLSAIETYLADGPATPDGAVRELSDRLGGLERAVRAGFGDAATTASQIAERLAVIERGAGEHPRGDHSEALLILDERLAAIESALDNRGRQAQATNVEIAERLRILDQLPSPATGETSLARAEALQSSLTQITARLDQVDERIRSESLVTEEALRGRDQDFDFIYNEIKQLGQSQATLNSAVNDWRNESHEHFGTLTARLDRLAPTQTVASAPKPAAIATDLPPGIVPASAATADGGAPVSSDLSAANVSAEDYELPEPPSRTFRYWLFGTNSIARANRESILEVGRMRRNIRDARERRRTQV